MNRAIKWTLSDGKVLEIIPFFSEAHHTVIETEMLAVALVITVKIKAVPDGRRHGPDPLGLRPLSGRPGPG